MKKFHFFLVILLFGIFLLPSVALACGGTGKSCTKEITSTKKEQKSCCEKSDNSDNDDKGCNGTCGHSDCGCSSTCPTSPITFLSEIIFNDIFVNYSFVEKVEFLYATPSISDGFSSIWLIPKIG